MVINNSESRQKIGKLGKHNLSPEKLAKTNKILEKKR
jgi:hypothetical protein